MKTNAYIFIFTTLIYNFIDLGNRNMHFISKKFLDDSWYCLMFGHLLYCWYDYAKRNNHKIIKFASMVCLGRLIYNFLILINFVQHTPYKATFFVPCFILFLSLLEKYGWGLSRLKRWVHGFTTRYF